MGNEVKYAKGTLIKHIPSGCVAPLESDCLLGHNTLCVKFPTPCMTESGYRMTTWYVRNCRPVDAQHNEAKQARIDANARAAMAQIVSAAAIEFLQDSSLDWDKFKETVASDAYDIAEQMELERAKRYENG